ncbi:response regulator [Roseococcus pinisoli]
MPDWIFFETKEPLWPSQASGRPQRERLRGSRHFCRRMAEGSPPPAAGNAGCRPTLMPNPSKSDPAGPAKPPLRVLLADDHDGMRRSLRRMLEADRRLLVCAEAKNGEEAVRQAAETRPDVAVLDLSMPLLSGVEAARLIRTTLPETRIVIVTLHPLPEGPTTDAEGLDVHAWVSKQEAAEQLVLAVLGVAGQLPE